ncbi:hypothetical protein GOD44_12335 [Sinorhizobium medicae]|nr:hypothetical protein [Sinorhizobium medicae]MDX0775254.1 hypothetical protein [Sinorhizobium medicae]MDX1059874.1 hypothetical protein [Sinorhizobium medicae]
MTFLEAYAKYGPDTMAIAEALDIKEHEADMLINMKMDNDYLRPPWCQRFATSPKPVRFAGYDETEKSWW